MSYYAELRVDLHCPTCGSYIGNGLWFAWGHSRSYELSDEPLPTYRLGDEISWYRCPDGSTFAWSSFIDEGDDHGANCGDPRYKDLIVRDGQLYAWAHRDQRRVCRNCHTRLEGGAVKIINGRIVRGWIYRSGEFDNSIYYYLLGEDGEIQPMPEWDSHEFQVVRSDCSPHSLDEA